MSITDKAIFHTEDLYEKQLTELQQKYDKLQKEYYEAQKKITELGSLCIFYKDEFDKSEEQIKAEKRKYESVCDLSREKYHNLLKENIKLLEQIKSLMAKE